MYEFEVFMSTMVTDFSTIVFADKKSKATYQAYKKWKGKELSGNISFHDFLRWFYTKTVQLN